MAHFADAANQPFKLWEVATVEHSFSGSGAEYNLGHAAEVPWLRRESRAREFQSMTTERNFRGRYYSYLCLRHQRPDQRHLLSKSCLNIRFVGTTYQPCGNIPTIENL